MGRVFVSWSSGKDAAWSLETIRQQDDLEIAGLLTTVAEADGRVGMHGTPREVLTAQAEALELPLLTVDLPWPASNQVYETALRSVLQRLSSEGIGHVAFGDLFLADVRRYREELFRGTGIEPIFPLWGRPTAPLAAEMIDGGLKARVTTIDRSVLPAELAGELFDGDFLRRLPSAVDPCGEAGEFHTVVFDAPSFRAPIPISLGDRLEEGGFCCAEPQLGT